MSQKLLQHGQGNKATKQRRIVLPLTVDLNSMGRPKTVVVSSFRIFQGAPLPSDFQGGNLTSSFQHPQGNKNNLPSHQLAWNRIGVSLKGTWSKPGPLAGSM